jgi:dienelactone hydrolase
MLVYQPQNATALPVIALHGCGGPFKKRDRQWAQLLTAQGHTVIFPNSFASRGIGGDCKAATHGASAYGPRRLDALTAAAWAAAQQPGGVLLMGWSDGGTTVLAALNNPPAGLIRGAIAFYPACTRTVKMADWAPSAPLLILMGADDDWTPPEPCQTLAARHPSIQMTLYPGAYHDFDVPNDPVHIITGLPYTRFHNHQAHAGGNPSARAAALLAVPAFFNQVK